MLKLNRSGRAMSNSEKTLLTILLVICVLFLYWIILMKPAMEKIKPVSTKVSELQEKVDAIGSIQSRITEKEETLKGLQTQYDEATKVIPRGDRYPQLIKEIREMSEATSVKITNYSLSKPTAYSQTGETTEATTSSLNTYTVNLSVTGKYTDVLAFVRKIEEDARIADVKTIASTKESASIELVYFISGTADDEKYDFNNGAYGKEDPFN